MYTPAEFAHLRFLEGRWRGTTPDGRPFYEAYDFPEATTLRSTRYDAAGFDTPTDESAVALEDGEIVSRWGEFTWRATKMGPDQACFAPVNAPSAFCWQRVGDARVDVVQRWTDEAGDDQSATVELERVA